MLGDFKNIMRGSKKQGGSSFGAGSSKSLQNFMNDVGAIDLEFFGSKFTRSNRRAGLANILERLDKGICNVDWQALFPKAGVKHLIAANSDHCPIILNTSMEMRKGVRPFRFEAIWTKDRSSLGVIENAWVSEVEGYQKFKLPKKLMRTSKELIAWNKSTFGYAQVRIKDIEERLKAIQLLEPSQENLSREATLCLELNDWLEREKLKLRKKSRELWLKEGDRNLKFFHLSTLVHRQRNQISEILLDDGRWINLREEIVSYFTSHFGDIYHSSQPSIP